MKPLIRSIHVFDVYLTRLVQAGPVWMGPVYASGTHLGDSWFLLFVSALGTAIFLTQGSTPYIKMLGLAILGMVTILLLKEIFRRTRPDTDYAALQSGFSFPSGHAGNTTILFGLLAYLLSMRVGGLWGAIGASACILLALLVGVSRVYLGAHFPSDVLAGWTIGTIIVANIIRYLGL